MKNRLLNCLRFFYTKFEMNAKTLKVFFLSWVGKKKELQSLQRGRV